MFIFISLFSKVYGGHNNIITEDAPINPMNIKERTLGSTQSMVHAEETIDKSIGSDSTMKLEEKDDKKVKNKEECDETLLNLQKKVKSGIPIRKQAEIIITEDHYEGLNQNKSNVEVDDIKGDNSDPLSSKLHPSKEVLAEKQTNETENGLVKEQNKTKIPILTKEPNQIENKSKTDEITNIDGETENLDQESEFNKNKIVSKETEELSKKENFEGTKEEKFIEEKIIIEIKEENKEPQQVIENLDNLKKLEEFIHTSYGEINKKGQQDAIESDTRESGFVGQASKVINLEIHSKEKLHEIDDLRINEKNSILKNEVINQSNETHEKETIEAGKEIDKMAENLSNVLLKNDNKKLPVKEATESVIENLCAETVTEFTPEYEILEISDKTIIKPMNKEGTDELPVNEATESVVGNEPFETITEFTPEDEIKDIPDKTITQTMDTVRTDDLTVKEATESVVENEPFETVTEFKPSDNINVANVKKKLKLKIKNTPFETIAKKELEKQTKEGPINNFTELIPEDETKEISIVTVSLPLNEVKMDEMPFDEVTKSVIENTPVERVTELIPEYKTKEISIVTVSQPLNEDRTDEMPVEKIPNSVIENTPVETVTELIPEDEIKEISGVTVSQPLNEDRTDEMPVEKIPNSVIENIPVETVTELIPEDEMPVDNIPESFIKNIPVETVTGNKDIINANKMPGETVSASINEVEMNDMPVDKITESAIENPILNSLIIDYAKQVPVETNTEPQNEINNENQSNFNNADEQPNLEQFNSDSDPQNQSQNLWERAKNNPVVAILVGIIAVTSLFLIFFTIYLLISSKKKVI